MVEIVVDALARLGGIAEPIGWLALAFFLVGAVVEWYDRSYARPVVVAAWLLFGLFWLSLIHFFAIDQRSLIEGAGSALAVPLSVYVGYVLARGRDSLFVLSRAIAVMGVVYVPFVTVDALRRPLIETVTAQTEFLLNLIGSRPEVVEGLEMTVQSGDTAMIADKTYPYESTFAFDNDNATLPYEISYGGLITYTIAIACTGIGSMAIFVGLIAAVDAPLDRKLRAFAVSIPVIYALNLVRNVFIAVTFGNQLTYVFPGLVKTLFSIEEDYLVPYMVSDRILAQSGSVIALVVITWLVVRELPEILLVIEDLLYLVTGREYDLQDALGVAGRYEGDSGPAEGDPADS